MSEDVSEESACFSDDDNEGRRSDCGADDDGPEDPEKELAELGSPDAAFDVTDKRPVGARTRASLSGLKRALEASDSHMPVSGALSAFRTWAHSRPPIKNWNDLVAMSGPWFTGRFTFRLQGRRATCGVESPNQAIRHDKLWDPMLSIAIATGSPPRILYSPLEREDRDYGDYDDYDDDEDDGEERCGVCGYRRICDWSCNDVRVGNDCIAKLKAWRAWCRALAAVLRAPKITDADLKTWLQALDDARNRLDLAARAIKKKYAAKRGDNRGEVSEDIEDDDEDDRERRRRRNTKRRAIDQDD